MDRFIVFLILTLILFKSDNYAQKIEQTFGDLKLETIHNEFLKDCETFGLTPMLFGKKLKIMDYEDLGFGYLGITFPKAGVILIDTNNMQSSEELYKIVVYHELAHFYLRAEHVDCEFCIMRSSLDVSRAKLIYKDFDLHKTMMFQMIKFKMFIRRQTVNDIFNNYNGSLKPKILRNE